MKWTTGQLEEAQSYLMQLYTEIPLQRKCSALQIFYDDASFIYTDSGTAYGNISLYTVGKLVRFICIMRMGRL